MPHTPAPAKLPGRKGIGSTATEARTKAGSWVSFSKHGAFAEIFVMANLDRAALVKTGAPAKIVRVISDEMDISKDRLVRITGLTRATVNRKIASKASLSADESERVVGLAKLIGQVETMVTESGNTEGFKPAKWFAEWIARPVPALGGRKPEEFLDTSDGREAVSQLLARMQSGVYA